MNRSKHAGMGKVAIGVLLVSLALASVHLVEAQQTGKIPRIGFIASASPEAVPNVEPLRAGLRELGYIEGKNILVEYRYADGMEDRLPGLVAELVQLRVDIIVTAVSSATRA